EACRKLAVSSSAPSLLMPELRMYAPVAARSGRWVGCMTTPRCGCLELAHVRPGQVDELGALAGQHRAHGEQGEPLGLLEGDGRRDRQLLPVGQHVENGRSVV